MTRNELLATLVRDWCSSKQARMLLGMSQQAVWKAAATGRITVLPLPGGAGRLYSRGDCERLARERKGEGS